MRICTTNPGKMAEFGGLLAPLGLTLKASVLTLDIPETGDTFKDNSIEKAKGYAKEYPGEWLLAEDSGLVVPALGGLPGPWSARYADLDTANRQVRESGRPRSVMDPLNNKRVLTYMGSFPPESRGAYFVACITVIDPQGNVAFVTEQRAYGWIALEERGTNGFAYDSLFISPTTGGKTWAEIDSARKDLISHRNKATWDLMAWLCSSKLDIQ